MSKPSYPRRNIELKAKLSNFEDALLIAAKISDSKLPIQQQVDTYFKVPEGRLKLREINHQEAVLIAYHRADEKNSIASDYTLIPISQPQLLITALSNTLGVWLSVHKTRHVFLFENVRIHLDRVDQLGTFLEFEAVLSNSKNEQQAPGQLNFLIHQFNIQESDLIDVSYSDLMQLANTSNDH